MIKHRTFAVVPCKSFLGGRMKIVTRMTVVFCGFLLTAGILSCGGKRHNSSTTPHVTGVESVFLKAASDSNIPVRMMLAAGYVESGLRANKSSVTYDLSGIALKKAPVRGESAFGFSFSELGLNNSDEHSLKTQIEAYGRYLKSHLGNEGFSPQAVTPEEKIRWIWKLASIHRGEAVQRNLLAVFSKEMIRVLNDGFTVQDGDGVVARLEKEGVPLRDQDLPENYRQDLQLDMYHSDIRSGYLFSLVRSNPSGQVNHPKKIEVIHCPFSLSTCIQMQNTSSDDAAMFGAHYVIPASDEFVPGILQFAHHDESVELIGVDGKPEVVTDRIVILLAGPSGRYTEGQRTYADPMWMSDFQMRLLGAAVSEVCSAISRSESLDREQCQSIGGASGVAFRTQPGESYRWGDIADFDETIVRPYLTGLEGISANTTLTMSPDMAQNAGSVFRLNAGFQATTRRLELERLVRCPAPDRRVVWEPVHQESIRNKSTFSIEQNWYDAGPNGTGDQYFRIKATGDGGKFLGWSTKRVQLKGFEKDAVPEAPTKYCLRNGT
jgi:hypothetical protein